MKKTENNVTENLNGIIEKKRKIYVIITIILCTLIVSLVGISVYYFNSRITSNEKNAYASTCVMPYTTGKCKYARNTTIKKVQQMLITLGYYKNSDGIDGNFGPKTVAAVKKFQKSQKITQDGYVGPDTLERLAKATNTKYFKIIYNKNGGTGTLKSQYNNTQVILNGINTKISTTTLRKSNSTHVGYTATSTVNGVKYRYGCFNRNCSSGSKAYTEAQINANKNTFYDYVYSIGVGVSQTGWVNGQTITFTAKYCPSGQTYNKKTSSCEKTNTNTSNSTVLASGTNKMLTAYNDTQTACGINVATKKTYNDKEYGEVRIVAANKLKSNYGCGTIVRLTATGNTKIKLENSQVNSIYAIVLDVGGHSEMKNGTRIDLLLGTNADNYPNPTVKYEVLRKGW